MAGELILGAGGAGSFACLKHLEDRNRLAERVIREYAAMHAGTDVAIGLLGFAIPGGSVLGLAASVLVQAPAFYQPMARRLARIYTAEADSETDSMVRDTAVAGAKFDVASEFAAKFFQQIAPELLHEAGLGVLLAGVPLIGPVVAAGLDAAIAATLTWRVGTMISMYYQNGLGWTGDRSGTYQRARALVGSLSPKIEGRVDLNDVANSNPEILESQVSAVAKTVRVLMGLSNDRKRILQILRELGLPGALAQLGVERAFARCASS